MRRSRLFSVAWRLAFMYTGWKVSVFGVFLVRIFPHSDWIRRGTVHLPVFIPNWGKFGPEKLWIRIFFTSLPKMKMLRKIIDCKSLGISQENFNDGVFFSKVSSLHSVFKLQLYCKENSPQVLFGICAEN